MSQLGPTILDFLGAFLLAGVCGGVGATGAYLLVRWRLDWTPPTTRRLTAVIGSITGLGYPAAWVVALDTVHRISADASVQNVSVGGGVPAVLATVTLSIILLCIIHIVKTNASRPGQWHPFGTVGFVAVFAVFLPVAFVTLLPILFPILVT